MMTRSTLFHLVATLAFVSTAQAAISMTPLGTAAPPGSYFVDGGGPFLLIPAMDDTSPIFADVTSAPLAPGKNVLFSSPMSHRSIGSGWATWSHGYTGDVYYSNAMSTVTLSFDQPNMQAFYFYAEPNFFGSHGMVFSATSDDGSSQTVTQDVEGQAGAVGFLIVTDGLSKIGAITITALDGTDFAVGEFGYAKSIPAPGALALLGLAGLISRRRRG